MGLRALGTKDAKREELKLRRLLREELQRGWAERDFLPRGLPVDEESEMELVRRLVVGDARLEELPPARAFYSVFEQQVLLGVESLLALGLPVTPTRVLMTFMAEGYGQGDSGGGVTWGQAELDLRLSVCRSMQGTSELTRKVLETWEQRKLIMEMQRVMEGLRTGRLPAAEAKALLRKLGA